MGKTRVELLRGGESSTSHQGLIRKAEEGLGIFKPKKTQGRNHDRTLTD